MEKLKSYYFVLVLLIVGVSSQVSATYILETYIASGYEVIIYSLQIATMLGLGAILRFLSERTSFRNVVGISLWIALLASVPLRAVSENFNPTLEQKIAHLCTAILCMFPFLLWPTPISLAAQRNIPLLERLTGVRNPYS